MSIRSQLLKGILEGSILSIIKQGPTYGYGLSVKLNEFGLSDISEGSIYPLLLRLQKENLISGEMRQSDAGPRRKYYSLTPSGHEALESFIYYWESIKKPVDLIIKKGEDMK